MGLIINPLVRILKDVQSQSFSLDLSCTNHLMIAHAISVTSAKFSIFVVKDRMMSHLTHQTSCPGAPLHTVGGLGNLKLDTWEAELGDDMERECFVQGIKTGFHIVSNFDFAHAECEKYNSALDPSVHDAVELQ